MYYSGNSGESDPISDPIREKKYIVFESKLLSLFTCCEKCHREVDVTKETNGSLLKITQHCSKCEHVKQWCSQDTISNIPIGNLLISSAILLCGLLPRKALRLLHFLNCQSFTPRTYFHHQKHIISAIKEIYRVEQSNILQSLRDAGKPLALGGDGRCDSPGYCAKYGSYTLMDLSQNTVLDIQLVQVKN